MIKLAAHSYQNFSVNLVFLIIFTIMLISNKNICSQASCMGCTELDELTFDKMLSKFQYSLIKFDIAFPYGEKHEAFSEFAKNHGAKIDELLVGLVGVKDYGEKENSILAQRYDINEKKYPAIILYKNYSSTEYIQYPEDKSITADNIKKFVKEQTNLYIGLDGCLKEFDLLVVNFIEKNNNEQLDIINMAKDIQDNLEGDKDKEKAKVYIIIMKRILEKGKNFIMDEQKRLENLLQGKISDNKKRELMQRFNILQSFQFEKNLEQKDEL